MALVYKHQREDLAKKGEIVYASQKRWQKVQEFGRKVSPIPKEMPESQLTPTGEYIAKNSYLKRDTSGKIIETPKEMFWRVAHNVASADLFYGPKKQVAKTREKFYRMLSNLEFIPNTPTLCNAAGALQQLSACFVLPIEDTLDSIGKTFWQTMMIHKTGGGTGFSFSRLRPYGSIVRSTGRASSGAVYFMWMYADATDRVQQGGYRRGANMGVMNIDHPDILRWITVKSTEATVSSFNLSVAISDGFMRKVEKDRQFAPDGLAPHEEELKKVIIGIQKVLRNPDLTFGDKVAGFEKQVQKLKEIVEAKHPGEGYELVNPDTKKVEARFNARKMFELLARLAWEKGDPGVIFLDRINEDNATPELGRIEATNPCIVGSTLVSTEKGLLPIEKIVKEELELRILTDNRVIGGNGVTLRPHNHLWNNGVKEVWRLVTRSGFELEATPDHKIMTTRGFVPLAKLRAGEDKVLIQSGQGVFSKNDKLPFEVRNTFKGRNGRTYRLNLPKTWSRELGQVLGFLVGDGWLRDGDKDCRVGFASSEKKKLEYFQRILNKWYGFPIKAVREKNEVWKLSYHSKHFVEFFKKLGIKPVKASEKVVPETLFTAPEEAVVGFLQGLFTADGTVNYREGQSSYVRLTSKSKKLLQQVQLPLLNLGIPSRIYDRSRKPRKGMFPYLARDGSWRSYETDGVLFELEISRQPVLRFLRDIGFLTKEHAKKIKKFYQKDFYEEVYYDLVSEVKPAGKENVFDLTEQGTSSYIANGMVISNCGEEPLLPYESCNLGAINLARMVKVNGEAGEIDWEKLKATVGKAVHFLDNVIDINNYPLPEIEEMTKGNRKIGLGVMGWANMLVHLGIPYNSRQAYDLAGKLMGFIMREAKRNSANLAKGRGVFPNFKGSIYDRESPHFKGEDLPLRNAALTTVAPTGTTSMLADVNSGIEPFFALWYKKNIVTGDQIETLNSHFVEIAKKRGFWSNELIEAVKKNKGSVKNLPEVPEDVQKLFPVARDLSPEDHIRVQAAFQNSGVDAAISKTINMPQNAKVEDIVNAYYLAHQMGCKGVTIYRDRSRIKQILEVAEEEESRSVVKRPRPDVVSGRTHRVKTPVGTAFIHVTRDEQGNVFEVFIGVGKAGSDISADAEAIGRLISLTLRIVPSASAHEIVDQIIDQLSGIGGRSSLGMGPNRMRSLADAIAQVLITERKIEQRGMSKDQDDGQVAIKLPIEDNSDNQEKDQEVQLVLGADLCPECGNNSLVAEEGCVKCLICGFSQC